MIVFDCPKCAESLEFGTDAAGSRVRCPACKEVVRVPEMEEPKFKATASTPPARDVFYERLLVAAEALLAFCFGLSAIPMMWFFIPPLAAVASSMAFSCMRRIGGNRAEIVAAVSFLLAAATGYGATMVGQVASRVIENMGKH